jgi:hypothetical protein
MRSHPTAHLHDHLALFLGYVLQDALNEANAAYWERRALDLDRARPRPGEWRATHITPESLRARDRALSEDAAACRELATLAPLQHRPVPDVWAALAEIEQDTRLLLTDAA